MAPATLLAFIRDSYRNPNVKRQAMYWFARCDDRLGRKAEAAATYQSSPRRRTTTSTPSSRRNAARSGPPTNVNPLTTNRPDWRDIAEQNMPQALRLGYELTALTDFRDAQAEIDRNRNRTNQQFADALLADLYHASGDTNRHAEDAPQRVSRAGHRRAGFRPVVLSEDVLPAEVRRLDPQLLEEQRRRSLHGHGPDPSGELLQLRERNRPSARPA